MVTIQVKMEQNEVGVNSLTDFLHTHDEISFDYIGAIPGENDTFIEVYEAEVDDDILPGFIRAAEDHPNFIEYTIK